MESVKTTLMKNLIDMGIVNYPSNNEISSSYTTPDNNYIIKLKRKPRLSFLSENSESSFLCDIDICTTYDTSMFNIKTTEIEISKMLDIFYNLIENNIGSECYYFFNPTSSNCIPKLIGLNIVQDPQILTNDYQYFYTINNNKFNMIFYDKLEDQLVQRISLQFTYSEIFELLEKIYYVFLIDIDTYDSNTEEDYY